ncbi:MAG: cysteine hydrolase [Actinobacteria bacterium]|nr:cysteine hydrolase [Actinomycetota bacterium]
MTERPEAGLSANRAAPPRNRAPAPEGPWLVVIDPQNIFAAPDSPWGSPMYPAAFANIRRLAEAAAGRVLVTRWLPTADRRTSWGDYFAAWPFADKPADDPLYDLVPEARDLSPHPTLDAPTFGKWGAIERFLPFDRLRARSKGVGSAPVVLTGVSTDCCVISTALAGADAGARITIAADACAGSDPANHAAALQVMSLYPPQLTVTDTEAALPLLQNPAS